MTIPVNFHCVPFLGFSFGWEMHENWGGIDFQLKVNINL